MYKILQAIVGAEIALIYAQMSVPYMLADMLSLLSPCRVPGSQVDLQDMCHIK